MKAAIAMGVLWAAVVAAGEGAVQTTNGTAKTDTAIFASGCFWCGEAVFEQTPGVTKVESGYTGGKTAQPTYQQVCAGDTGHAEAIRVTFDPSKVTYAKLLEVFWHAHDPTQLNRQGNDVGDQYRSAIFYLDEQQRASAESSKTAEEKSGRHGGKPVVTVIEKAGVFYPAEDYHQEYYRNHREQPYCRYTIRPKLEKLGLKP